MHVCHCQLTRTYTHTHTRSLSLTCTHFLSLSHLHSCTYTHTHTPQVLDHLSLVPEQSRVAQYVRKTLAKKRRSGGGKVGGGKGGCDGVDGEGCDKTGGYSGRSGAKVKIEGQKLI